jgi:hypothetical protein
MVDQLIKLGLDALAKHPVETAVIGSLAQQAP